MSFFERWREQGSDVEGAGRSAGITVSGLLAVAIVAMHGGGGAVLDRGEPLDAGAQEAVTLAQRQGARKVLVERRAKEMRLLGTAGVDRDDQIVRYAHALIRARDLAKDAGEAYASDDLIGAIADAATAGGTDADLIWILDRSEGDRRLVALSRYYILLRRGERSNTAAAIALRN